MKPSAFIHLATWQRIYRSFAAALGVTVAGGDSSQLPGGGTAFHFDSASAPVVPFTVTRRGATGYHIEGGLVIFLGRIYYLPPTLFATGEGYVIGVRLKFEIEANYNGVGNPWDIIPAFTNVPQFESVSQFSFLDSPPTNATIRDLNAPGGGTEDIVTEAGLVLWPLAITTTAAPVQLWTRGHIGLEIRENGRLLTTTGYPAAS